MPYIHNRDISRDVPRRVLVKVCGAIEDAYGRLAPSVYDHHEFETNRMACLQRVINDKHFSEKSGSTFVNVVDHNEIKRWIETRNVSPRFVFACVDAVDASAEQRRRLRSPSPPHQLRTHFLSVGMRSSWSIK